METEEIIEQSVEVTAEEPKPKKRPFAGLYAHEKDPHFKDSISKHPQVRQIDLDILGRELTFAQIVKKWELSGTWTVSRRRKKLLKDAAKAHKNRVKDAARHRTWRAGKRALELMEDPLHRALGGFDKIMELANTPQDVERGATYLEQYLAAVRTYGELNGEMGPAVQQNNYNVHQNLLNVMSLPRVSDTPEQIARAAQMGLPQPQVIEAQGVPYPDEDEDEMD